MHVDRALRIALLGGAAGSFIGPVHAAAIRLDGRARIVAGVFSRDPERSRAAAPAFGVSPGRVYLSLDALIAGEAARAPDERVEALVIATPNAGHAEQSIAAAEAGLAIMCEKPPTRTLAEARQVQAALAANGVPYALAYTYLGYPLVRELRGRIAAGEIGAVRRVAVEYVQGWLSAPAEREGNTQAAWRTDPAVSGPSGCLADIGVHAQSLVEFAIGEPIAEVLADVRAAVPGRRLDDDVALLFRTASGVRGTLLASQVCTGARNGLSIRVWGERGALTWHQEQPNLLVLARPDGREEAIPAGSRALVDKDARRLTRLPVGHPEGYLEAFGNIYRDFAALVRGEQAWLPGIAEGVRSMAFVETALASSASGGIWTRVAEPVA